MNKKYLVSGDIVYATGCYLMWDGQAFQVSQLCDVSDEFFEGKEVRYNMDDDNILGKPYIEVEG